MSRKLLELLALSINVFFHQGASRGIGPFSVTLIPPAVISVLSEVGS